MNASAQRRPRHNSPFSRAIFSTLLLLSAGSALAQSGAELSGTININIVSSSQNVWQTMANEYMKLHPKVTVKVGLKPTQGYSDYINAGFAAGTPTFDLVQSNGNLELLRAGKFLDLGPYFNQVSPYTKKPWRETLDLPAIQAANTLPDKTYQLNLENVQILWFYNKDIFDKLGLKAPTTWPELLSASAKIKQAGYIPLALAGDYDSLWGGNAGWLFRMYQDQYTRSLIQEYRSRPGDYTYNQAVDPKWKYNGKDIYNDDPDKVSINLLRRYSAIQKSFGDTPAQAKTDRWRLDSDPMKDLAKNFHSLLSQYTPPGWYGINHDAAYSLFLQGKAAMAVETGGVLGSFEKDLKNSKLVGDKGAAKPFTLGVFNNPSMTGSYVEAPARTIQVAIDFLSVPKKSFAQNKLNVDFMMWLSSPTGFGKYVSASVADPNGSLVGPPTVKGVKLPADLAARFAAVKQIGNTEKGIERTSGAGARGFDDYQPSVRTWVNLVQQYLADKITLNEYVKTNQQNLQKDFNDVLKTRKFAPSDLKTPEKAPPERP